MALTTITMTPEELRAIEAAASAPLLERIATLEKCLFLMQNDAIDLKAQVEQAAKPVAWRVRHLYGADGMDKRTGDWRHIDFCPEPGKDMQVEPLYTAPPKAVPLTDEQCDEIASFLDDWARNYDGYEYGLPLHRDKEEWRTRIREAAHGITPATVEKGETP